MASSTQHRSMSLGISAGVAAGVVGAVIWAVITAATSTRIGYLAIGVGALVGFAMGKLGRGPVNGPLPIIAGAITLVAVVVGDAFGWASAVVGEAQDQGFEGLSTFGLATGLITGSYEFMGESIPVRDGYREDFEPIIFLFAAIGVAAAFSICRKMLDQQQAPAAPPAGAPYDPRDQYAPHSYGSPPPPPPHAPAQYFSPPQGGGYDQPRFDPQTGRPLEPAPGQQFGQPAVQSDQYGGPGQQQPGSYPPPPPPSA